MAEAWASRPLPAVVPLPVATSQRHSRLPSTSPKILVAAVYSLEWLPRITMSVLSWIWGPLIWP